MAKQQQIISKPTPAHKPTPPPSLVIREGSTNAKTIVAVISKKN